MAAKFNYKEIKMKIDGKILKLFVTDLIQAHKLELKIGGALSTFLKSEVVEQQIYEFAIKETMTLVLYEV
jgi:hypothetical protein